MVKRRAKNIDDCAIQQIVGVLDGWAAKLSWDLLVDEIEKRLGVRYTRQTLDKHARIKIAYQCTKQRLSEAYSPEHQKKLACQELGPIMERLERLAVENARLRAENGHMLEQFVTWAYNAHLKGLTKEYLNTPLPRVDREVTLGTLGRRANGKV
ncbi:hypothetical protein [Pseudomonas sp. RIT-PI-a]|uniref:hypothetical protein n=1 Tax=Pseudomonas sp. RIT-PI-a TaxID=1681194 RepID=UPI000675CF99|nr:hypothetical protein [Pseudomonas sp. RIT-PI-a]KNC13655.1 hypothetical protein AC788_11745 [Pseudomonas sp. RIT-PI-a]